jgi:hypothetical protein
MTLGRGRARYAVVRLLHPNTTTILISRRMLQVVEVLAIFDRQ